MPCRSTLIKGSERPRSAFLLPVRAIFEAIVLPPFPKMTAFGQHIPGGVLPFCDLPQRPTSRPIEYYLKSYRRQAHLSQKELAYLLGATTPAKVSRYEAGLRIPSLESGLPTRLRSGSRSRNSSAVGTRRSRRRLKSGCGSSKARSAENIPSSDGFSRKKANPCGRRWRSTCLLQLLQDPRSHQDDPGDGGRSDPAPVMDSR